MKNSRLMIAVAVALFALIDSAFAQTGAVRVTIPFDFTVGRQTMVAGDYKVSINSSLLEVARVDGPGNATVMTNPTGGGPNPATTPRLVFHRYGSRHFLSQAWIGESNGGHQLYASAAELEYARAVKQDQETVLASRLPSR